jgi:hypothetical protein
MISPSVRLLFVAATYIVSITVIISVLAKLALAIMLLGLWRFYAHAQCCCNAWSLGVNHSTIHKFELSKLENVDIIINAVKELHHQIMVMFHELTIKREFSASMS